MKQKHYVAPEIQVLLARVEKGYQLSGEPNGREPFGENDIDGGWTEGVGGNTHLYTFK